MLLLGGGGTEWWCVAGAVEAGLGELVWVVVSPPATVIGSMLGAGTLDAARPVTL